MPKTPTDVVHSFVAAINAADPHALRALMTENHTFTDARGNSFSGADKMQFGWQHFFQTYPAYQVRVRHSFAEANRVALFGDAEGGWRVNEIVLAQRWAVSAAWLAEVENEQIKSWTVFCDTAWVNPPV
jgi:limonene-1,2-epoxide hydrolase